MAYLHQEIGRGPVLLYGDPGQTHPAGEVPALDPSIDGVHMKKLLPFAAAFVLGILVSQLLMPTASAQFRAVKTNRLLTVDLADWCDGKEVTVELNEVGAGSSGKHYHPAHSFTYVLEGSEIYAVEGETSKTVTAGDVLHEPPMQVHTVDNSLPVKLLVVRVIDKGKQATVRLP
jgi:mannose-6-phosphate isomerase-like protein (cupin superfamily)